MATKSKGSEGILQKEKKQKDKFHLWIEEEIDVEVASEKETSFN